MLPPLAVILQYDTPCTPAFTCVCWSGFSCYTLRHTVSRTMGNGCRSHSSKTVSSKRFVLMHECPHYLLLMESGTADITQRLFHIFFSSSEKLLYNAYCSIQCFFCFTEVLNLIALYGNQNCRTKGSWLWLAVAYHCIYMQSFKYRLPSRRVRPLAESPMSLKKWTAKEVPWMPKLTSFASHSPATCISTYLLTVRLQYLRVGGSYTQGTATSGLVCTPHIHVYTFTFLRIPITTFGISAGIPCYILTVSWENRAFDCHLSCTSNWRRTSNLHLSHVATFMTSTAH